MENALTDKLFWESYWASKTELIAPIPPKDPIYPVLDEVIKKNNIKSSIELGGFPGYYSIYVSQKHNIDATLLDFYIHHGMLDQIAEVNKIEAQKIKRIESDLLNSVAQEQYDLVFSCGLIEHFSDTKNIIEKHLNYLKSGGTLLITLPNLKSVNGWVQKTFDRNNYDKHFIECMNIDLLQNIAHELELSNVSCHYYWKFSVWLENKQHKSFFANTCVKSIWLLGKIITKIIPFESKILSPYIVLSATKK